MKEKIKSEQRTEEKNKNHITYICSDMCIYWCRIFIESASVREVAAYVISANDRIYNSGGR